jgi:hypothetical protein
VAESKRPDSRGLSFFDITDFSPGIYNNSLIAAGPPVGLLSDPGLFPAPPGAADAAGTFGCMAMPNGGLGPLPQNDFPDGVSLGGIGITTTYPADITALTNSFQVNPDELIFGITGAPSGGSQTTSFYSWIFGDPGVLNTLETASYNFSAGAKNFCAYPFASIINQSGQFQPVVVLPLTAPAGPTSALMTYPDPATPTVFGTGLVATTPVGTAFGHQGRIVAIQINNGYGWPATVTTFPNEGFSYTDPPETVTWPHQFEIFGPESPFGYGAISSVSAGELFAVKCRGGAVIIQGDLNNPTVTSLPGVKSTGVLYGRTDTDQNGFYYCVNKEGAWVWNGGNSSQKISQQLDDNFFLVDNPISDTTYYGYYCQRWGDWMMFSNNWVFNSTTGGWWRLSDPALNSYFWYVAAYDSRYMYASTATVQNSTEGFMTLYDREKPATSFTWQSLPIKLPSEDRTSTARELVIRASNPYADTAPQIIATLIDDKGNTSVLDTWTMNPTIDTVQETRLNCSVKQTTTIAVNLAVSGALYAPVVYGLSMGTRAREHTGIT